MHKIQFSKQSAKSLKKLFKYDTKLAKIIVAYIEKLCENPNPNNSKKIVSYPCYHLRVSNYRIIYEFNDNNIIITVIEKRDKIYQKLKKLYSGKKYFL